MKKQELTNDPQEQWQSLTGSIPSSDQSKDEKGKAQSSESMIHPVKGDCYSYFQTGKCRFGRSCKFYHPPTLPQELREKAYRPVCKYFLRGRCLKGSNCNLLHTTNKDGAERMPQSVSERASGSRQGFEASGSRQGFEASGFKRPRTPVNSSVNAQENLQEKRQENVKRQRIEAQETLQQQRLMEMPENFNVEAHNQQNPQEQRKIERMRRLRVDLELPEKTNVPLCKHFPEGCCKKGSYCKFSHTMDIQEPPEKINRPLCKYFPKGKCIKGQDCGFRHVMNKDGSELMRQTRNESRQGFEASGFRRPKTPENPHVNAQVNLQQQRLEVAENHNIEAHDEGNTEEQRKIEIQKQRMEERSRLARMRPTALFNEASRPKQLMEEFGHKGAKGL